jgi:hypothetical protein
LPEIPGAGDDGGDRAETPSDLVTPMVTPADVFSCHTVTSFDVGQMDTEGVHQKQNPLQNKGFDAICHLLSSDDSSEADGTRTRNHRIDSPVL